jgi:hypothetical protein
MIVPNSDLRHVALSDSRSLWWSKGAPLDVFVSGSALNRGRLSAPTPDAIVAHHTRRSIVAQCEMLRTSDWLNRDHTMFERRISDSKSTEGIAAPTIHTTIRVTCAELPRIPLNIDDFSVWKSHVDRHARVDEPIWTARGLIDHAITIIVNGVATLFGLWNTAASRIDHTVAVIVERVAAYLESWKNPALACAPMPVGVTLLNASRAGRREELEPTGSGFPRCAWAVFIASAITIAIGTVALFGSGRLISLACGVAPITPFDARGLACLDAIRACAHAAIGEASGKTGLSFRRSARATVVDSTVLVVVESVATTLDTRKWSGRVEPTLPEIEIHPHRATDEGQHPSSG